MIIDPTLFSDRRKFLGYMDTLMKKYFLSKKRCEANGFISDCSGNVIRSHTISKKYLRRIASEDGHVYYFDNRLLGRYERDGRVALKKVGISKAATYYMFCSHHDNSIFSPIEDDEIIPNEQQCLLLMYRSLIREKYLKEAQYFFWNYINNNMSYLFNREMIDIHLEGSRNAIKDSTLINMHISSAIKNNDVSRLRSLRVYFKKKPGFLCSGAFFPEYDYLGSRLWGAHSIVPTEDFLSISIIPLLGGSLNDCNGVAILSWLDNPGQNYCQHFIESMHSIPKSDVSNVFIHTIFEFIENVCISPSWWESREEVVQNALMYLITVYIHSPLKYNEIKMQYDNWNITEAQLWNGQTWIPFSFS